jgi:glycosyltransferase involved in cell wall biosynthesis
MSPAKIAAEDRQTGVSVIVPAYNCERWIRSCLDSILASEYPRELLEVICVDNASTDRTPEILQDYGASVTVIRETKRGASAARNAGLRAASGPLVAFTDADCIVDAGWLGRIVEPLRKGVADAAGGRIRARPGAGPVERFGELIHDHSKAITQSRPPYLITMNMSAPLELLRSVGCFEERWMRLQDVDLSFRMLAAGGRFAYAGDAVVYHHNRDTLPALAREGFLHGYLRPKFFEVHDDFINSYREKHPVREFCPQPERPPAAEGLEPWRIALYRTVFNAGKKAGKIRGRLFSVKS